MLGNRRRSAVAIPAVDQRQQLILGPDPAGLSAQRNQNFFFAAGQCQRLSAESDVLLPIDLPAVLADPRTPLFSAQMGLNAAAQNAQACLLYTSRCV